MFPTTWLLIIFIFLGCVLFINSSSSSSSRSSLKASEYKVLCKEGNSFDCTQGTVAIDPSIRVVEESTFADNFISGVDFSGCSELHTIGIKAFQGNKIKSVNFDHLKSLKMIERNAFENNQLTSVDLLGLNKLTLIDDNAFQNNKISVLTLPYYLKTIGTNAFKTNNLESLDLSKMHSLSTIYIGAFAQNKISKVNMTGCKSLKTISAFAFYENDLKDVRIPASVEYLGLKAFHNNPDLNFACYEGKKQPIGAKDAFQDTFDIESFLRCPPPKYKRDVYDEYALDPDGTLDL